MSYSLNPKPYSPVCHNRSGPPGTQPGSPVVAAGGINFLFPLVAVAQAGMDRLDRSFRPRRGLQVHGAVGHGQGCGALLLAPLEAASCAALTSRDSLLMRAHKTSQLLCIFCHLSDDCELISRFGSLPRGFRLPTTSTSSFHAHHAQGIADRQEAAGVQPLASSQASGQSQHSGPLAVSGGNQPAAPQQRRLQSDSQSDGRASSSGGAHAGLLAETQPANRALSEDAAPGQAAVRLTAGAPVGAGSRGHEGSTTVLGGGEKSLVDRHIVATQAAAQAQVLEILQSPRLK